MSTKENMAELAYELCPINFLSFKDIISLIYHIQKYTKIEASEVSTVIARALVLS